MRVSRTLENLIYLYVLRFPDIDAEILFNSWERNIILREYKRPSVEYLKLLIISFHEELEDIGVKFN